MNSDSQLMSQNTTRDNRRKILTRTIKKWSRLFEERLWFHTKQNTIEYFTVYFTYISFDQYTQFFSCHSLTWLRLMVSNTQPSVKAPLETVWKEAATLIHLPPLFVFLLSLQFSFYQTFNYLLLFAFVTF